MLLLIMWLSDQSILPGGGGGGDVPRVSLERISLITNVEMQTNMIDENLQKLDGDESNELESLVKTHIQFSLQLLIEKTKITF